MQEYPFGQLIDYEGTDLERLRRYTEEHSGNLIFAKLNVPQEGEFYFIYANNVEMRIPTLKKFNDLREYIGKIPEADPSKWQDWDSTTIVDFIQSYVKNCLRWGNIDKNGQSVLPYVPGDDDMPTED